MVSGFTEDSDENVEYSIAGIIAETIYKIKRKKDIELERIQKMLCNESI